jgi:hypothetical protein
MISAARAAAFFLPSGGSRGGGVVSTQPKRLLSPKIVAISACRS